MTDLRIGKFTRPSHSVRSGPGLLARLQYAGHAITVMITQLLCQSHLRQCTLPLIPLTALATPEYWLSTGCTKCTDHSTHVGQSTNLVTCNILQAVYSLTLIIMIIPALLPFPFAGLTFISGFLT